MTQLRSAPRPERTRLILWMTILASITVFVGFAKTFYLKFLFDTPQLGLLPRIHGLVMTCWMSIFIAQVVLVSRRRVDLHRKLGQAGVWLAAIVVIVGVITAIAAAKRDSATDTGSLRFLTVPLFDMTIFSVLTGAGLWLRRKKEAHRRLMLLGVLAITPAAVGRLPISFLPISSPIVFFGLPDLAATVVVSIDTLRNRRLHPAYGWGLLLLVASHPLRLLLSETALWLDFSKWLTSLL